MTVIVSACLLGAMCKYNGGSNKNESLLKALSAHRVIPVCPEVDGGLCVPREPAEIVGDRVLSVSGKDVTRQYRLGAEKALQTALSEQADIAVLQERSPSCGTEQVYDGTFTHTLRSGKGITAALLAEHGITVMDPGMFLRTFSECTIEKDPFAEEKPGGML